MTATFRPCVTKQILRHTIAEADRLDHEKVGVAHLMLGIQKNLRFLFRRGAPAPQCHEVYVGYRATLGSAQ
jgi:hypothetical protein